MMSQQPINEFRSTVPAPDGTPLGNLRHTLAAFPDKPADELVAQASSNVYGPDEPGVIVRGARGATYTGLTWRDLRVILAELDAARARVDELVTMDKGLNISLDATRRRLAEVEADNEQLRQGVAQARRLLNAPAADTTSGGWHDGEDHECPRDSRVHAATSRCADYAVKHGDRTYLGPRG